MTENEKEKIRRMYLRPNTTITSLATKLGLPYAVVCAVCRFTQGRDPRGRPQRITRNDVLDMVARRNRGELLPKIAKAHSLSVNQVSLLTRLSL